MESDSDHEAESYAYDDVAARKLLTNADHMAPVQAASSSPMQSAKQSAAKLPAAAEPPVPATREGDSRGPLLVYEAWLQLAVYEVENRQRQAIAIAESYGGFLARQEAAEVVLRVPASRYGEALAEIDQLGNLLSRRMRTHEATEEFRDLETRLDSARKVRLRLIELLEKAVNVEESLAIERELERLLKEIERMEGKLKFLTDRIAFSTITVAFRPLAEEQPADDLKLPFVWLDGLGLRNLTELER